MENEKMKNLIVQILKFGVVGGISCVIDFAVYSVMIYVFHIDYKIATFFGFMISLIFNYVASMAFVFERKENASKVAEFTIFAVLSVIGLLLTEGIIIVIVEGYRAIGGIGIALIDNTIEVIAKIVATGIVMIYNFVTRKIFIEKHD